MYFFKSFEALSNILKIIRKIKRHLLGTTHAKYNLKTKHSGSFEKQILFFKLTYFIDDTQNITIALRHKWAAPLIG